MKKDVEVFVRELQWIHVFGKVKSKSGEVVAVIKNHRVLTSSDDFIKSLIPTDTTKRYRLPDVYNNKNLYDVIDTRSNSVIAYMDKYRNVYDVDGYYIGTLGNAGYLNYALHILTVLTIIAVILAAISLRESASRDVDSTITIVERDGTVAEEVWNIFGAEKADKILFPGRNYIYHFTVINDHDVDILFNISFTADNNADVPIRYKLESPSGYLFGSELSWVDLFDMNVENISIPANSSVTFALHWMWRSESDRKDTIIGNLDDTHYTIYVEYSSTIDDGVVNG